MTSFNSVCSGELTSASSLQKPAQECTVVPPTKVAATPVMAQTATDRPASRISSTASLTKCVLPHPGGPVRKILVPPTSSWKTRRRSPPTREETTTRAGRTATDRRSALPARACPARLPPRYAHVTCRRSCSPRPAQAALSAPASTGRTAAGRAAGSASRRGLPRGQGGLGGACGASVDWERPCTGTPFALVEPPKTKKKAVAHEGSATSTNESTPAKKERRGVPCRAI